MKKSSVMRKRNSVYLFLLQKLAYLFNLHIKQVRFAGVLFPEAASIYVKIQFWIFSWSLISIIGKLSIQH